LKWLGFVGAALMLRPMDGAASAIDPT